MFFRYVYDEPFDEFHSRDAFRYCLMIFMSGVMKRNKVAVIGINTRSGDDRASQISADIFDGDIRSTPIGFCSDIKTIRIFFIKC